MPNAYCDYIANKLMGNQKSNRNLNFDQTAQKENIGIIFKDSKQKQFQL